MNLNGRQPLKEDAYREILTDCNADLLMLVPIWLKSNMNHLRYNNTGEETYVARTSRGCDGYHLGLIVRFLSIFQIQDLYL